MPLDVKVSHRSGPSSLGTDSEGSLSARKYTDLKRPVDHPRTPSMPSQNPLSNLNFQTHTLTIKTEKEDKKRRQSIAISGVSSSENSKNTLNTTFKRKWTAVKEGGKTKIETMHLAIADTGGFRRTNTTALTDNGVPG